jgi:hypothetical protein
MEPECSSKNAVTVKCNGVRLMLWRIDVRHFSLLGHTFAITTVCVQMWHPHEDAAQCMSAHFIKLPTYMLQCGSNFVVSVRGMGGSLDGLWKFN